MNASFDDAPYIQAYRCLNEALLLIDKEYRVRFASPLYLSTFNVTTDSLLGADITTVLGAGITPSIAQLDTVAQGVNHWSGEVSVGADSATESRFVHIDVVFDSQEHQGYLLRFISPRQQDIQQAALQEKAYHDELTRLPNRALFNQLLKHQISQCQRNKSRFALMFLDLDRFKWVNDTFGHDAGDLLLSTLAERLEHTLRKSDIVARLGGDEFVVIMNNIRDLQTIANVADKIIRQISKPVTEGAHHLQVGCSIGISIYPENGVSAEALLHQADQAMYRAKKQGGADYFYFSDALNQELEDSRRVEHSIREGLASSAFEPFFQPQIDQRSGRIVGIECLARWRCPEHGIRTPIEFIPVAKKAGLMHDILLQVLDKALGEIAGWQSYLQGRVPLSINMTSQQFHQPNTFEQLSRMLADVALGNDALRIEVTESALQKDGDAFLEQLKKINMAGFGITLDDFGTGYSSLRYLQQLPVDTLKIDRSFVRNLAHNPQDRIIVKAIIQLAQTLGIDAVAEGVETEQQEQFLRDNECYLMQGFLYSEALSAPDFRDFLAARNG
ncbi:bifunctional diguanylate cyclase/phosphodiesterase [Aestuariibacter halophilus]|uniref:Bifunctional diguanylate cyclase/phosphodiesterase n=1 Tax=Fluctibacter halophilus TaxID=226011 RepID=A0ABS8G4A6_9ALTE|nr:bifunctional diguanylate cyclase/phosphodiesterase [Aestuariibacter halophilus]MCC2615334.1 bifunctional diguanylate cyclase/phosphodiesterase [Aestuariibacter halophilus]